jgi:hypothetical protein
MQSAKKTALNYKILRMKEDIREETNRIRTNQKMNTMEMNKPFA